MDAVSDESVTNNNCSPAVTVAVGAAPAPDLVVDAPTVDTSAPTAGARFTLSATVRNQGNGRSDSTTLRYYQSADTTITTSDTEVGTDSVSRLDPSQSGDESISLDAPSTPGTYYYGACVDEVSDESDTTNNCSPAVTVAVGAAPAPDLVVDAPTVDTSAPTAGARFTLSATVRNQGNGASAFTTLRYYQSTDSTITTSDTEVGTDSVSGLSLSGVSDESISLDAPSTPGTYHYGVCVEAVSGESDTTNNCSAAAEVTVTTPSSDPDLVVDMGGGTGTSVAGTSFTINLAVRNQGFGATSVSTTLRYYRSTDAVITDGDTEVGTDTVSPLGGSHGLSRHSIDLIAPSTKGTYYYGACVDAVPGETNNTNNCSSALTITISALGPDLVVTQVNAPATDLIVGEDFRVSIHVENQGDSRALSPTARFYRSADATISTSDTEIETVRLRHMEPSQRFDGGSIRAHAIAPSTAGTYYYGACLDPVDGESDTTNNCSSAESVTVVSASGSDLVIESFWIQDYPGLLPLHARVRNQGAGLAATTPVSFYLSTDATISTSDTRIDGQYVGRLAPSETGIAQVSTSAPSTPGTYYYGACVQAVSGETDTTNNCSTAVVVTVGGQPAPDLVVDAPTVDIGAPAAGDRFTLNATVRNQGKGASAFTTLRYYQSADPTITTSDTEVGTDSVSGLNPSGVSDESISLTAPSTPGTYYYGACVDSGSDESDTTNNCSAAITVTVGAVSAPDLVVDTPTVSDSSPTAGASFALSATVRNQGNGSSSSTTLRYYQSTDTTITTSDTAVGTGSVSGLSSTGSSGGTISLTAPSTTGTHYYGACVDAVSDESVTNNNCSVAVTVTVGAAPAPDLVVDTPTVSENAPTAGASFTLSATVRNQGNGSSADSTTLRYYRSTDSTIKASDTSVGADVVAILAASGSSSESISLTAPSTPGRYYYGTCVDAVSGESDTTNNCSSAVTVNVGSGNSYGVGDLLPGVPTSGLFIPAVTVGASVSSSGGSTTITFTNGGYIELQDGTRYTCQSTGGCGVHNGEVTQGTIVSQTTSVLTSDLIVDPPTVDTSTPAAGARITLNATVRNQGNGSSAFTTLRYYRSIDATINTSDTAVGTDSVSGLNASGVSDESMSPTAPSTPGTYYYGACVDSVSDESDTTNNCSVAVTVTVVAVPLPDLVVDTPTVSDSAPAIGARFTLSATVRNQGSGWSGSTTLRYYQSTDPTITTGDTEVGTDSVRRLEGSETGNEYISLPAPSPGTYYYGACVDSVSDETDTSNNCSAAVTVAIEGPDLVVGQPRLATGAGLPTPGASFTLRATVNNQGAAPSDRSFLHFYQSTDTTITTADRAIGNASVIPLGVQGGYVTSGRPIAPSTAGTYYYGACVEAVSAESDTTNNCSTALTLVFGPDLSVGTFSDFSLTAGASFAPLFGVENRGNMPSVSTTLRYLRSADSTITISDTEVGTDQVSKLSAGETQTKVARLFAPTPGTYYYGACVDSVTDEIDAQNNCGAGFTVTVRGGGPDMVVDTLEVSGRDLATGVQFALSAGVRNQGNGWSHATTLRYYQSADATITTADTEVGTYFVSGLGASASHLFSLSDKWTTITAPSTPGTYYYGACVDAVTGESDTANNCSGAAVVTVAPAPDLVVDTPTVETSAPAAGASFTLSATVRNQGRGRSSYFTTLRYYQSADSTITTGDTELGTDVVSRLDPSQSEDESISLTAPASPGTYYYGACVDWENAESDKSNNCSAAVEITLVPADLVVDTPTTTFSHPNIGTFFPMDVSVRNQGNLASEPTTLNFYRSTDSTITTSDEQTHSDSVGVLTLNETVSLHSSLRAPSKPGTYYYGACVVSVQDESNTTNNCSPAVKVVASQPDLVVDTPWTSHSDAVADSIIDIHAVVRNQGTGHLPRDVAFNVYLSTDSTVTVDDTRANGFTWQPVDMLASSEGLTVPVYAPRTAGEYYYYACVDAVREESNTTNNCSAAVKVTVRPADLVILLPTVAGNTTVGERFTLYATVLNQGDVRSDRTTIRYYRSTDATITSADTPVGTDWVGLLTGHETSHKSISLTAPRRDGTYYYGACVDTVADESSSTNNCSEAVEVTVGARPLSLRLTSCFVFQEQHFVMFEVRARIPLSSVVVHTYQVEGRNNRRHLMQTTNVGDLAAGSSYSKLTSRLFPSGLRYYLTTCTASVEWDNGTVTPVYSPGQTTIPDLPPPPPTYTPPTYEPRRIPTERQVNDLFHAVIYSDYGNCGYSGAPPCPAHDYLGWWFAQPPKVQECAFRPFRHCDFGE